MASLPPDRMRLAKAVVARLVELEPRPATHGPGWLVTVERRIRNERWPDVCTLVAQHPDLDPQTLADMASPTVASPPAGGIFQTTEATPPPLEEWAGPDDDPTAGPYVDDPTEKLAAARTRLTTARKPPMGDPPISTRGRVA